MTEPDPSKLVAPARHRSDLLDGAVSVFEGGAPAEGATNEAQVDLLYRQIGQLKVENDFLARKLCN